MWNARYIGKDGRRCGAPLFNKGRGNWGLVLFSHGRKGGSSIRMYGARKGKSCRIELGGLLLLLRFAEKSNGRGLDGLRNHCIKELFSRYVSTRSGDTW